MSEMQGRLVTMQLDFVLEDFHVIKFKQGSTWNELKLIITNDGQPFELDSSEQYKYRLQGVNPKGEAILIDAETVSGNYLTFKNIDEGITHEDGEGTISLSVWDNENNLINILIENVVLQIIENKFYSSTIYEDNRLQALNNLIFNASTSTVECQNATVECVAKTLECEAVTRNCETKTTECVNQTNDCEIITEECETLTNLIQSKLDNNEFKGDKGDKGDTGLGFAIVKIYSTTSEMINDTSPVQDGQMVAVIHSGTADIYLRSTNISANGNGDLNGYKYLTNLIDASVIKGDKGDKGDRGDRGIKGEKGDTGSGFTIAKTYQSLSDMLSDTSVIDGSLVALVGVTTRIYIKSTGIVENIVTGDYNNYKFFLDMTDVQILQGEKGEDGYSVQVVENEFNSDTVYKLDIFTVDGTITTPNLRGRDGEGSGDMIKSIYDPNNREEDIFALIDGKADATDIPTTLPANGGNADTVDNKHASDFADVNHTHTKASIGLGNVDNTADANKRVSYASTSNYATNSSNSDMVDNVHVSYLINNSGLREINAGLTDLQAGESSLRQGQIYIMYE